MPFSVILVEPEIAANVGFVARTLACYQIRDLRIVGGVSAAAEEARRTGASALDILAGARSFMDLKSALADLHLALGFTFRPRDAAQRIHDLRDAVALVSGAGPEARVGLVFGRESRGLSREDTLLATHLVRIPLPQDNMSLNLSHAVAIALYALFEGAPVKYGTGNAPGEPVLPLAESEKILSTLLARLAERGRLNPAKADAHEGYLRSLWQRLQPSRRELEFLAGLLRKLEA